MARACLRNMSPLSWPAATVRRPAAELQLVLVYRPQGVHGKATQLTKGTVK